MKAIMVMYDTLNRQYLPNYGCEDIVAPNFKRLGERCVTFENSYVGSMPCMPARREIHTGRLNFLHRGWSPLEPFDDSMPEILSRAGIYTHMISDHQHYWEDGGATYHSRYNTWEIVRGQEGDKWKGNLSPDIKSEKSFGGMEKPPGMVSDFHRQDAINRTYMEQEKERPQSQTFDGGLEFIETNKDYDNWFLQIETFDPHEPFFSTSEYESLYPKGKYDGPDYDWPPYGACNEDEDLIEHIRRKYKALMSMCDKNLGKVLDMMDKYNMWEDTMLIINTDHGYLLGEHEWWSKSIMPMYDEICHTPLFIWDPRSGKKNIRNSQLVQTIDLAPTLLDFFNVPVPKDMMGVPLGKTISDNSKVRDYALFGYFGAHVNITDGQYVYMHSPKDEANEPLNEYTLMPMHMRMRFSPQETATAEMHDGFNFTKGSKVMKINAYSAAQQFNAWHRYGDKLYNLTSDPKQEAPLEDRKKMLEMINEMLCLMRKNDTPSEQYERLGLPEIGEMTEKMLDERICKMALVKVPPEIAGFDFTMQAAEQVRVLLGLSKDNGREAILTPLKDYLEKAELKQVGVNEIDSFVKANFDNGKLSGILQLLRLAARKD